MGFFCAYKNKSLNIFVLTINCIRFVETKIDMKECTKCKLNKSKSLFNKIKGGTRNGKQRYKHSSICIECQENDRKFKECSICKKNLPKTEKYFNVRKEKKKGTDIVYSFFRYACRSCLNNKNAKQRKYDYHKDIDLARKKNRDKYSRNPELYRSINKKHKLKYREFYLEIDRKRVRDLDDSWVASNLGIPLKEIPIEILETKKILLRLKRELKNNNVKIR